MDSGEEEEWAATVGAGLVEEMGSDSLSLQPDGALDLQLLPT
jgi:hypothetical protein